MEWDQEVHEQDGLQEEEAHEGALLQAEEDWAWQNNLRISNKTGEGKQVINPPIHILDNYSASYHGATRGGPGNPYAAH